MWVELSVNSIVPGLELVEKLGRVKDDRVQMEPRLQELNEYIQLASDAIASRAGKVRFAKIISRRSFLPSRLISLTI